MEIEGRLPANRLVRVRVTAGFDGRWRRCKLPPRIRRKPFVHASQANAILSVRSCARGDSGKPRMAGSDDFWRSTIALDKRSAKSFIRINDRIRAREIRVIDENGEQMGILPPFEALKIARERGLDLVEVSPNAVPPVCRIQDYGRFLYEKEKSERAARKKQKVIVVKEVKFSVTVDEHDYQTKKNQAVKLPRRRRQGEGQPALPRPANGSSRPGLQHHQPADSGHWRRRNGRVHAAHGRHDSARNPRAGQEAGSSQAQTSRAPADSGCTNVPASAVRVSTQNLIFEWKMGRPHRAALTLWSVLDSLSICESDFYCCQFCCF